MEAPATRLLLVRHAQHETSARDGALTRLGEVQAEALARAAWLADIGSVASSPRRRALATASVLGREFDVVEGLAEFDFGPGAPAPHEMLAERTDLTLWQPADDFPGGETLGAFQTRVAATLEALVRDHEGEAVLAVTHAGVIDAALRWAYGLSPETEWTTEASVPNASLTEIEHWPSGRRIDGAPRFTLIHRVGDVSHLDPGAVTDL